MSAVLDLLGRVIADVVETSRATWPFLLVSIVVATALTSLVPIERLSSALRRRTPEAVAGAVVLASATPFCSCGTTAVALGMIASTAPWAPIVAFLVASPLTSPSELFLAAGLLGWPFAWWFFIATMLLGLAAGAITAVVERTGWLAGQARMDVGCGPDCASSSEPARQPLSVAAAPAASGAPAVAGAVDEQSRPHLRGLVRDGLALGRRVVGFFVAFTALGYLVIEAVPTAWLQSLLNGSSPLAILSAAVLGVPMYVNTEGSLPLVAGLMAGGMSPGAGLAFLITGAGTSIGAVTGMLVIARRRVVGLTVALLLVGAVVLGMATDLVLA